MSAAPVRLRRKNSLNLLKDASKLQSFDEFPVLREEVDPQLHVSNNSVDQPFAVVCEKDTVIAQMSGQARVNFAAGAVRFFDLGPGDHVYVPAGTEHRVHTLAQGIQLRYRAREPGVEGVVWRCEGCGGELDRHVWDCAKVAPQAGYQAALDQFNADASRRACKTCGKQHDQIDVSPFRWGKVAEALSAEDDDF